MKEIIGTSNRVLAINLSSREVKEFSITEKDRRLYLGGKGIGLKLISDRLQPGTDPLGNDNIMIIMIRTLLLNGMICTAEWVLTPSPQEGHWPMLWKREKRGL
jgi:aldehyde:ferredoxin oxidoreductase